MRLVLLQTGADLKQVRKDQAKMAKSSTYMDSWILRDRAVTNPFSAMRNNVVQYLAHH